jgi:hypothetical protein
LAASDAAENAPVSPESPGKFANYKDTVQLQRDKLPKRGPVSPYDDDTDVTAAEASGRHVRFQPRSGSGPEPLPSLHAQDESVFTVGKEPSDECGMFRRDAQLVADVGASTPGGFALRPDTEAQALEAKRDFEAREDTEVLRMGTTGASAIREDTELLGKRGHTGVFSIREDTEVLGNGTATGAFTICEDTEVVGKTMDAFAIREDTEVLAKGGHTGVFSVRQDTDVVGKTTGAFSIREDTEVLGRGAVTESFAVREDTEVLGRAHNTTGVFAVREDTEVLGAAYTATSAFAVREDTEVLGRVHNTTGAFSVREDTEVLNTGRVHNTTGAFSVREDTEVLNAAAFAVREDREVLAGEAQKKPARPKGLAVCADSNTAPQPGRSDSVRTLADTGPRAPPAGGLEPSCDLAAMRAPSSHLRPTSGSLPDGAGTAPPPRSSQQLRESSARRKLQFVDGSSAEPGLGLLAPRTASLLAAGSSSAPLPEEFTVLEDGAAAAGDSAHGSARRESFGSDEDTENAAAAGHTRRGGASRSAADMLRTLDDRPEHVLQWGGASEYNGESLPNSAATSPAQHAGASALAGGSASLPSSPLKTRGSGALSRKPPLSPNKALQVRAPAAPPLVLYLCSGVAKGQGRAAV